ncbi:hypothetical protein KC336_g18092 [Hortaea werneckii]|nr:hypothetical protein KC336_g18092 [Hortaea werneckii]
MIHTSYFRTCENCPEDGFRLCERCRSALFPSDEDDRLFKTELADDCTEIIYGEKPWTFLSCPAERNWTVFDEPQAHIDIVVIAVDGACRDNGKPHAKASYGVFFHRDNHAWNKLETLFNDFKTNQQAELRAGLAGLQSAKKLRLLNTELCGKSRPQGPIRKLSRVIIKTDSAYLVNALTDWVFKWRENDYTNSRGRPVTNAGLFRQLDAELKELADLDVHVQFWHVR